MRVNPIFLLQASGFLVLSSTAMVKADTHGIGLG